MDEIVERINKMEIGEDEAFAYETVHTLDWDAEESIHDLYYRAETMFEELSNALDVAMGEHDPDMGELVPLEVTDGLKEFRFWGVETSPEPVLVVGWMHESDDEGPVEIMAALVDLSKVPDGHFIDEIRYP